MGSEESQIKDQAIFQTDRRMKIDAERINTLPYSVIGQIASMFYTAKDNHAATLNGSGFMISQDLVMTVAHNVYHPINAVSKDCTFKLMLCDNESITYKVVQYFIPKEYIGLQGNKIEQRFYDYAILRVKPIDHPVSKLELLPLARYQSIPTQSILMVYGYPEDLNQRFSGRGKNLVNIKHMYGESGKLLQFQAGMIGYRAATNSGQSGCPVILVNPQGKYQIIGIHRGIGPGKYNEALSLSRLINVLENTWKLDIKVMTSDFEQYKMKKEILQQKLQKWRPSNKDMSQNIEKKMSTLNENMQKAYSLKESTLKQITIQENQTARFSALKLPNAAMLCIIHHNIQDISQLFLNGNSLTAEGVEWLTFRKWSSLDFLNLSDNNIENLSNWNPSNIQNVTHLLLKNNKLSDLPKNLKQLSFLQLLTISENKFKRLPPVLQEIKRLKLPLSSIEIYDNQIDFLEEENKKMIDFLIKEGKIKLGQQYQSGHDYHYEKQNKSK